MATIHVGDGRQRRGRFGEQVAEPACIVGQRTGSLFVRCPADTTPLHTGPLPAQLHGFDDGAIQMGDDLPAIPLAAHRRWCIRLGPGFFELPEQIVLRDAGGELADADTATGDEGVGHDHLFVRLVVGLCLHRRQKHSREHDAGGQIPCMLANTPLAGHGSIIDFHDLPAGENQGLAVRPSRVAGRDADRC